MRDINNPADVAKHELIARAQEQLEPFLAAQIAHQRQLFTRDLENRVARHFPSTTPFDEVRFTGEAYEVMEIAAHEAAAEAVANCLLRRERSQSPRSHAPWMRWSIGISGRCGSAAGKKGARRLTGSERPARPSWVRQEVHSSHEIVTVHVRRGCLTSKKGRAARFFEGAARPSGRVWRGLGLLPRNGNGARAPGLP
jgi:hypothetical protein